ncbi:MAG TPA: acyltransferase [Pseudolabrys sp.]|jgi:peptidoglycan/LPS O-acetylase OafA/YrhL|nr:acyltransferase [Pseudolabrys sp.]
MPVSPAASHAPKPIPKSLPGLTGLRGLAALWVVLYHYCCLYLPALDGDWLGGLLSRGYLAVDLFFLLSGFVLAHVYSDAAERKGLTFFRSFMRARVARIYPLHLFVLALFLAMAFAVRGIHYVQDGAYYPLPLTGARSLEALVANVLMLQGVQAGELSWNYPTWSISVEFAAYLMFPLVVGLLWRVSGRTLLAAALAALVAVWALGYVAGGDMNQWDGLTALWRGLPQFFLGCICYRVYRQGLVDARAWAGLVFAAALLMLYFDYRDVVVLTLFPLVILCAVSARGVSGRILNARPVVLLGEISFSVYLVHGLVQHATTHALNALKLDHTEFSVGHSWLALVLMLLVVFVLSIASYRFFERPMRRWLNERPKMAARHALAADPSFAAH